jgi:ABC-2 type transport system ATP-binding protein
MTVIDYLRFVGRLKGISSSELNDRTTQAMKRCAALDVQDKLISKLSKGYRQRVGLAQAIIHNPEVLILDEPTSGLDPKQINETRELIKSLAGDHTIILSTHILPEVESVCRDVIIINQGRVVATDSVARLRSGSGSGSIALQVETGGQADALAVRQRLEQVPGVSKVIDRVTTPPLFSFDVEALSGQTIRGDVARAVVQSGWNLLELKSSVQSLEAVFLQLTGAEPTQEVKQ